MEDKSQDQFKESDAGDGTRREDHYLTGSRLVICATSILLCMLLIALDQLIVAPVLTKIADHFNAFKKMTWMFAAYLVAMGGCGQTWGRISISFGRKWVMVAAIFLFEIGSLVAGVAQSMNTFIVGRAIQGVGASGVQTLSTVLITEISSIDKRPLLLGGVNAVFMIASVLGPILGGVFSTYTTWRWCFYINLCFGAVVFPLFIFTYRTRPPVGAFRERLKTVDFLDNLLMIGAIVLICLGISFGEVDGWKSASMISSFTIGGVLLVAFCIYNFKFSKFPVIPPAIVKTPMIMTAFASYTFNYSTVLIMIQYLSVYFETVANHDPLHTGLSILPLAIPMTFAAVSSAVLIKITGILKPYTLVSAVLLSVGSGLMLLLPIHEKMGYTIGFQIVLGIGIGLGFNGPLMSSMIHAPKAPGSTILTTSFMNSIRSVVCAIMTLLSGVIYNESLVNSLRKIASNLDNQSISAVTLGSNLGLMSGLDEHDKRMIVEQVLQSIRKAIWLGVASALACFVSTLFMSNKRTPKKENVVNVVNKRGEDIEKNSSEEQQTDG